MFLQVASQGHPLAVLDVPLLFESGGETHVDFVAVVSASPEVQRGRVMARPGMSQGKFEAILARQVGQAGVTTHTVLMRHACASTLVSQRFSGQQLHNRPFPEEGSRMELHACLALLLSQ